MSDPIGEYDSKYGSYYDKHDRDDNSGVRFKEAMRKIARLALKKLTDRQKSVYTRFYVDMKSAAEIAAEDDIHISAVYRHLAKAQRHFLDIKDEVMILNDRNSTFINFVQTAKEFTPECCQIAHAYYLNALPMREIAEKLGKKIRTINNNIKYIREQMSWHGISEADLKALRNLSKDTINPENDDGLTERQQSVYRRFYEDKKTVAEIAKEDGVNISAIYRHLRKAKKNLGE